MLHTLANMTAKKPFLTKRTTEALAQDQAFPHPHVNVADDAAINMHGFESRTILKESELCRFEGIVALPLSAHTVACRHVFQTMKPC